MASPAAIDPLLIDAAVFLGASVVSVTLFRRLGLGAILGYLCAGAIVGPHVLALIDGAERVLHFAEFGVVLLLFVIGLELRPARLWRMRAEIFGLGLAQVLLTGTVIAGGLIWVGVLAWPGAVALGSALALSSTAFGVQILRDRGEFTRPHGDRAFAILLFQDLAIVPILGLVAFLAPGGGVAEDGWTQLAKAVAAVLAVVLAGRYGLRPLFALIARVRAEEIFTAAALMIVLGAALIMQMAGLSMAMGAFIAGVLLAESEFRHQLETDIEPFRGLLLGLFFMGVGMSVDWPLVVANWWIALAGAFGLYLLKAAILLGLTRITGSSPADALRISALLGQGGEFGFVVLGVGAVAALWPSGMGTLVAAIITLSMALTPLAVLVADRLLRRRGGQDLSGIERMDEAAAAPVIVAGFGRFGQVVARVLKQRGYDVTLIDNDPDRIRIARTFGNKVFFGDLRRADLLRAVRAGEARAIFVCGDDREANAIALRKLRARMPNLPIFCRAADRFEELRLAKLGATGVVRENFESAVALARTALGVLGDGAMADEVIEEFRRRDAELLRLQGEFGAEAGYARMRESYSLDDKR
ncbi:monovalent cation:proton antiporter-2 (CPA2) family protein [Limibaculum sp. FT325]|uniref:monovalent cation:proton antiporter-2 (CPA2) family protein n=1 Tax=Thermohalobaculum sediminis TaxID=2939436 RepID=UPI0020C05516|nr:monovalent cation:proton antiporter-2 (CPA2) family protein [Limibaculum sediminis]MCL5778024.1 monovalent cation:proton antiporter-2 (CPA2) family protein [Limibaculum sediminis]